MTDAGAALVTGAARRIGKAIAEDLALHGHAVAVHFNGSADEAAATVDGIRAAGGRAVPLQADLRDPAALPRLVSEAEKALGRPLTLLVNNASLFEKDTLRTVTPESFGAHVDVNLRAPLLLAQAFAARLPQDAAGNIVNLIDQRVWKPTPYFVSYTLAKSALLTLTQTLAMALAPRVRVNAVGPGPVLANERQTARQFERQWRSTPLGRGATPAEIAAAIRFILAAPAMTGQMLALDGGQFLPWPLPSPDAADLDG